MVISRSKSLFIIFVLVFFKISVIEGNYFAIEQCPGTDVASIRQQSEHHEVSLIFFYTQWNEDSLEALKKFHDVAKWYSEHIYFATVDCYQLQCNCTKTLTSSVGSGMPHEWPTLIAYYGRKWKLKIRYHGLWDVVDLSTFIDNILQPLDRIETKEDVENYKLFSDVVVLGVFENAETNEYKQYLIASLKWLENDPLRSHRFLVNFANDSQTQRIEEKVAKKLPILLATSGLKASAEAKHFTTPFSWNASNIIQWLRADDKHHQLYSYTTPITIAQKLRKYPVLSLFVQEPDAFYKYVTEQFALHKYFFSEMSLCKKLKRKPNLLNDAEINSILQNLKFYKNCQSYHEYILKNLKYYYEIVNYLDYMFGNKAHYSSETQIILNYYYDTYCRHSHSLANSQAIRIGVVKKLNNILLEASNSVQNNKTLSLVILDAHRYRDLLENLDISPTAKSMTTSFIADRQNESVYVMYEEFNITNFIKFIINYYRNVLTSHDKNQQLEHQLFSLGKPQRNGDDSDNYFTIKSLNRYIFLNYLQIIHNQTLVVSIYSPTCALCANLQHTLIQLASALGEISSDIRFLKMNSFANDLPWQYNVDKLPSLLVFPKQRFSNSRIFPSSLKPDFRNVFAFILNQLAPQDQIKTILALCQSSSLPTFQVQSCWEFAKTIIMSHIGKHLHYWQLFESERSIIFERLSAFKDMSLSIQRNLRL